MRAERIKRIIGLLLLGAFLAYFANKLFTHVDSLLAILILAMVAFVAVLGWYVILK